jgi:hypothetical protein
VATWDITVSAGSTVGSGTDVLLTTISGVVPGDFDGATINSVTVQGTPTVTSDGTTDDTIEVRFFVTTTVPADTFGGDGSNAASMCYASVGDSASSANITDGTARSPNPTTAVAADWDEVRYSINYSANMKDDGETISWSSFTVRVDYTSSQTFNENHSMSGTGTVALARTITFTKAHSAQGSLALTRTITFIKAFSATGTLALQRTITLIKAIGATGTSVLSYGLQYTIQAAMSATGTPVMTAATTYLQALTHSATGSVAIQRTIGLVKSIGASGSVTLQRSITLIKAISAVGTSALTRTQDYVRSFSHSAVGSVVVAKVASFAQTLAHAATGAVAMTKNFIPGGGGGGSTMGNALNRSAKAMRTFFGRRQ